MATTENETEVISQEIYLKARYPEIPNTKYLTHGFDRYPAKMIPHMARFFIEHVSGKRQTILDPFCGSGSVLLESRVLDRNAIGIDNNPLAILLAQAKTNLYNIGALKTQLNDIIRLSKSASYAHEYTFYNAEYWFTPATLHKLGVLRSTLDNYLQNVSNIESIFWKALLTMIVRDCSRADTRGPKPFISKTAIIKRKGKHFDPISIYQRKAILWIDSINDYLKRLEEAKSQPSVTLIQGDTRKLSKLVAENTVDAVVTSPPYLNAQDYYRSSKLQLYILGQISQDDLRNWSRDLIGSDRLLFDESLLSIPLESNLAEMVRSEIRRVSKTKTSVFSKYVLDMYKVITEIKKVLTREGYCAVAIAPTLMSGVVVPIPEIIIDLMSKANFKLENWYVDEIMDRWVPIIRNGHNGVVKQEHLLIFKNTC